MAVDFNGTWELDRNSENFEYYLQAYGKFFDGSKKIMPTLAKHMSD